MSEVLTFRYKIQMEFPIIAMTMWHLLLSLEIERFHRRIVSGLGPVLICGKTIHSKVLLSSDELVL